MLKHRGRQLQKMMMPIQTAADDTLICLADFCLCWGFTAQPTRWGHVERGQFT